MAEKEHFYYINCPKILSNSSRYSLFFTNRKGGKESYAGAY
jgi:hypothetical protein